VSEILYLRVGMSNNVSLDLLVESQLKLNGFNHFNEEITQAVGIATSGQPGSLADESKVLEIKQDTRANSKIRINR
jgi:hypothetical protein